MSSSRESFEIEYWNSRGLALSVAHPRSDGDLRKGRKASSGRQKWFGNCEIDERLFRFGSERKQIPFARLKAGAQWIRNLECNRFDMPLNELPPRAFGIASNVSGTQRSQCAVRDGEV
jgi:hypothetical protein